MTDIIPASSIDYRNVDEICAYRLLLCKIYECDGGFNMPVQGTSLTREIKRQSKIWLREVKSLIGLILDRDTTDGSATLADIPRLIAGYDILYRIAYSNPCLDYLREVKLHTADRWLHGDKSITRTDVVLLLLSETDRGIHSLEKRYAEYSIKVMSSWIDELRMYGEFADTSLAETYHRLSYLLKEDLFAHMGKKEENKVKSQWVSSHILTESRIDALDTETLWAYANFIDSIPFNSQQEYALNDTMYMHILSKIASHPDTHPYAAKAIELTSKRRAELIA